MSRAQERAEKHWDGYVGPMQRVILEQMVEMCMAVGRFHYISSHIHGVKHAEQDAVEAARGAFANAAAHKAPSLCDSGVVKGAAICCHFVRERDFCAKHGLQYLCHHCPDYLHDPFRTVCVDAKP